MTFGYKDNFHFRTIRLEDEIKVRKIIYPILESYGLQVDETGVDGDLLNIIEHYKNGLFGVVELSDTKEIIGSFALYPISTEDVELRKMYLLEKYRGKGIGKWIINFCETYAKSKGFQRIVLETATSLKEAIGLYRSFGYQDSLEENHTERCDIMMYKNLK